LGGGKKVDENKLGLAELIDPMDERELEALAVSAIKEHRLRLAKAEEAYEAWVSVQGEESDHVRQLKATYIQAMLDSHAHMSVVEVLVGKLGRIPSIDGEDGADTIK
jgi:TraR antiactivator